MVPMFTGPFDQPPYVMFKHYQVMRAPVGPHNLEAHRRMHDRASSRLVLLNLVWTNEQAGIRRQRGYGGIPLAPFPINLVKVHQTECFPD